MAWSLVQSAKTSVNGSTSGTVNFGSNVTAGNLLLVGIAVYHNAGTASTIINTPTDSFGGNTYLAIPSAENIWVGITGGNVHQNWYYVPTGSGGADTVSFSVNSGDFITVLIAEFNPGGTGTITLADHHENGSNSAITAFDSGNFSASNGDLVLGFCTTTSGSNPATYTEGSSNSVSFNNAIKETNGSANETAALEYLLATSGGNYSGNYTTDNVTGAIVGAAFHFASSAGDSGPSLHFGESGPVRSGSIVILLDRKVYYPPGFARRKAVRVFQGQRTPRPALKEFRPCLSSMESTARPLRARLRKPV